MWRPEFVDVDDEPRIVTHQRARSAGMVQMNVRQKNSVELRYG